MSNEGRPETKTPLGPPPSPRRRACRVVVAEHGSFHLALARTVEALALVRPARLLGGASPTRSLHFHDSPHFCACKAAPITGIGHGLVGVALWPGFGLWRLFLSTALVLAARNQSFPPLTH